MLKGPMDYIPILIISTFVLVLLLFLDAVNAVQLG